MFLDHCLKVLVGIFHLVLFLAIDVNAKGLIAQVEKVFEFFVMSGCQVAKMSGTGGQLYTALSNNRPSAAEMLKAYRLFVGCCPFIQLSHYFGNSAILHAFGDAKRVHIVDYGILYGVQWPCLIYHLSQLPGGPPHLRITGII